MKAACIAVICLLGLDLQAQGTMYSLKKTTYSQNFDFPDSLDWRGLSSAVPVGWTFFETGPSANLTYLAGNGDSFLGDTYSFGPQGSARSDRAFGTLRDGNLSSIIGVNFQNDLGSPITSLNISYTGEQWHLGTRTGDTPDRLVFSYKIGGGTLTDGSWIQVNNLDFLSPTTSGSAGALNGNDPANQTAVSYTLSDLNIADGQSFWLRWADFDNRDGNDGLAIDNFSMTIIPEPSLWGLGGGMLLGWLVLRKRRAPDDSASDSTN